MGGGLGRGKWLGSERAVVGMSGAPGSGAIGVGGDGVGRGKALAPERVQEEAVGKPARAASDGTGMSGLPRYRSRESACQAGPNLGAVLEYEGCTGWVRLSAVSPLSRLAKCPTHTMHRAWTAARGSGVEPAGAGQRPIDLEVQSDSEARRAHDAGSGIGFCGVRKAKAPLAGGVTDREVGEGTRGADIQRAGAHRNAWGVVGGRPTTARPHVAPGSDREVLDRLVALCDGPEMAGRGNTAPGPADSNADRCIRRIAATCRFGRRSNELMNLRADDAAAVAGVVDSAASKRRGPGPQLINGAFGRCGLGVGNS